MLLVFSGVWTFLVDAYPSYAASALAANTFARCRSFQKPNHHYQFVFRANSRTGMFGGAFPLFGNQSKSSENVPWLVLGILTFCKVYETLGFQWATSLLAFLALAMMPFP